MSPVTTAEILSPPPSQVEQKPTDFGGMFNSVLEDKIVLAPETLADARGKLEEIAGVDEEAKPVADETPPTETTQTVSPVAEETTTTAPDTSAPEIKTDETSASPEPQPNPVIKDDLRLTEQEQADYITVVNLAKTKFADHKHLLTLGKPTPDDLMGLLKVGMAGSSLGAAAVLDLIDQLDKDKLPPGTQDLKIKLEKIALNQNQQLLKIAQDNGLLTPEEIANIEKSGDAALPKVLEKIEFSVKHSRSTNAQNFLKDPRVFGKDFQLNFAGILAQAGVMPTDPREQQKICEQFAPVWDNLSTTTQEKVLELSKKGLKTTGLILIFLAFMAMQSGGKEQ